MKWVGAALLGPGVLTYTGAIGVTERHAHHAVQLMAASTELVVADDNGDVHVGTRVVIPADAGYAIAVGAAAAVAIFVDPDAALGAAVNARLGRAWSDNALLDPIDPADPDPRAAVAALIRTSAPDLAQPSLDRRHPIVVAALEVLLRPNSPVHVRRTRHGRQTRLPVGLRQPIALPLHAS